MLKWLHKIIIGWIELIYSFSNAGYRISNNNQRQFSAYLSSYKKQLSHFMYTHYTHTRIRRLFDIVIDYPDSKPALDDLKLCLSKTQLRSHVIKSLRSSIEQRLLHPGVNTSDILTAYVSAIKVSYQNQNGYLVLVLIFILLLIKYGYHNINI